MTALTEYELKPADVEFLLTIRDIEQKPKDYDNTDLGETVANVTVLKDETSLTKSQIAYRAREGENGRGFAEDDMGLIRIHPPTVEGGSFGPRSVELTDHGLKVAAEIESQRGGSGDGGAAASDAKINELEQQISELESQIENISESIEEIQRSEMGAIDADVADRISAALRFFPRHQFILSDVIGVDMNALANADNLDSVDKDELRREILNTLSESEAGDNSEPSGADPQSVLDDQ